MLRAAEEHTRNWRAPALFGYGFRPFFLFAAIWAVLAMALWLLALSGAVHLPTRFDPVSWHAHEFLFGYLGAVLAGFLLTAVPNWTGRGPVKGWPLGVLVALWLGGRVAVLCSGVATAGLAMVFDLAFPLALGGLVLREIVIGRNWRNLVVWILVLVFTVANAIFHIEAMNGGPAAQGVGLRLGLATAVMMIVLIGGRIIPSFTSNWLARVGETVRPSPPMQLFDKLVVLASVPILASWVVQPDARNTGIALFAMGLLHVARLARWQGHRTCKEPLVWVLHVSYGFVPAGACALGVALMIGQPGSIAAQHLWMSGAVGSMTLAVMTRATLGHTGQDLTANTATTCLYLLVFASIAARLGSPVLPALNYVSGSFWLAAFAGFVWTYGPLLAKAR